MSGASPHAQGLQQPLDRLVLFSDAVIAIAITLLVIEIHVPKIPPDASDAAYWRALFSLIPNFVGFAISFGVIGAFWIGHHRALSLVGRFDRRIIGPNLLLLGAIAIMPFLTAFHSAYHGRLVPAALYWGWLVFTALINAWVIATVTAPAMRATDVGEREAAAVRRRSHSVILGALASFSIALVIPAFGFIGMGTIPVWNRLLTAWARRNE